MKTAFALATEQDGQGVGKADAEPRAERGAAEDRLRKVSSESRPGVKLKVRGIDEVDIEQVIDLLCRGFPERTSAYWSRGFEYLRVRPVPQAYPRFGYVLVHGDEIVGVLLLIFATADDGSIRANVSSWYVEPAYRIYSNMLIGPALRMQGVTLFNISPAPQTIESIRSQRFTQYVHGTFFAFAAMGGPKSDVTIRQVLPNSDAGASLLEQHAARGCISLELTSEGRTHRFMFVRGLAFSGRLRCVQLIYCRDYKDFVAFAGPLGRWLLMRGYPFVMMDANSSIPGLAGFYFEGRRRKFFRGPVAPRLGDLSLTELMVFGP